MVEVISALLVVATWPALAGEKPPQVVASEGAPRAATGKHCLGEPTEKLYLNHTLVGSINQLGMENRLNLASCVPLIRGRGLMFDHTNLQVGVAHYLSPTHVHLGPVISVAPLSILVLSAEVTGLIIWPMPVEGAGYTRLPGYSSFTAKSLSPPTIGRSATRRSITTPGATYPFAARAIG